MGIAAGSAGWNPLRGWEPPGPHGCGQGLGEHGKEREGPAWESLPEPRLPPPPPPTLSVPLLRLRASVWGKGNLHVQVSIHISPPTRAGSTLTTPKRGVGWGAKRINKEREAQKHCLLKTTTPAYSSYGSLPQPGAEGLWRRNLGAFPFPEHHLQLALQAAGVHCFPVPASPVTGNTPESKAKAGGG